MAKFLTTTGVSHELEQLIKGANEKLILISPYLQFSERIKEHLKNLNLLKRDIRIVFRENTLQVEENNWLENQTGIQTSLCKNLHAKCYINEKAAIITSMNLYEFSQQNNNEMGILISKDEDPELYNATMEEVKRLLNISEEIRISVRKVSKNNTQQFETKQHESKPSLNTTSKIKTGYCIRTGVAIPFNVEKPMTLDAYKSWSKYGDSDYPEKYCHFSGEPSNGETSVNKPILKKNWKKAKEIFEL